MQLSYQVAQDTVKYVRINTGCEKIRVFINNKWDNSSSNPITSP